MILTIKTDQPQAELALYKEKQQVAHVAWEGHKQLSDTLLRKISDILTSQEQSLAALTGLVVFEGPGSFTGLRIGATVANTLSYGLGIPVAGEGGDNWHLHGVERVLRGENDGIVKPVYGGTANITKPRK